MPSSVKIISPLRGFREKRFSPKEHNPLQVVFNGEVCPVHNISDTGAAFLTQKSYSPGTEININLNLFNREPISLKGHVIWSRPSEKGQLHGVNFTREYLPEGFLEAIDALDLFKIQMRSEIDLFYQVKDDFKLLTFKIKNYLSIVKKHMETIEDSTRIYSEGIRNAYKEVIKSQFEPDFVTTLKEYSRDLDKIFTSLKDKEIRKAYITFFRKEVGEYYSQNPFIGRALRKPLGYAGDFEMMNQIYRESYEGNSLFEMLMHRYGINESSSLSVKYRKEYFCEKIMSLSEGKNVFTFASMACGPAQEVQLFLSRVNPVFSEKFRIVLVDQDVEALLNAKRSIQSILIARDLKCEVHFLPISVKQIIEHGEEAKLLSTFDFDLVYSAGLYDYLTQPVAKILTAELAQLITSNGMLILGNFHPNNPTKTISELVADWRLIHRDDEEMIDLSTAINFKSRHLHKDDQEIDLFLEIVIK